MADLSSVDSLVPLLNVNRRELRGFMHYFSNRPQHFMDLFGLEYSDKVGAKVFQKVNEDWESEINMRGLRF